MTKEEVKRELDSYHVKRVEEELYKAHRELINKGENRDHLEYQDENFSLAKIAIKNGKKFNHEKLKEFFDDKEMKGNYMYGIREYLDKNEREKVIKALGWESL